MDYGSGNIHSIIHSLATAVNELDVPGKVAAARSEREVMNCDYLVLPGVGAFADCKNGLEKLGGVSAACHRHALERRRPFLGICVGMQLLAESGDEFVATEGLGWIRGKVVRLKDAPRLPHMGWNDVAFTRRHHLAVGLAAGSHFYFDHSYVFAGESADELLATCDYEKTFTAAVAKDNIAGVQFHPEKSQGVGLAFLRNFIRWRP